jgi:hypothetical protein
MTGRDHPTLATPTASSDSISTVVTSCSEVTGCIRHCAIFFGERQARAAEQRLVAILEEFWEFRSEPGRRQRVEDRSQHDEDREARASSASLEG